MTRTALLFTLLLAVALGAARLRMPEAPQPQAATAPAQVRIEEVEVADTETTLEKLLPRRSAGHAAGLHKVADALDLDSSVALVMDARSQQVKFSKNEQAVLPIASLTKLMTGLVIAESGLPMDELLTIAEDDVDVERRSRSRLKVGTTLSRGEALRLALMASENRAAHALARTHPAGLQSFVASMNARARALGMAHTTYVDPTGLSAANQSSARDIADLALAASRHPLLRDYSTTPLHRTDIGARTLQYVNSNRLVRSGHWDIALQKTGYIIEAGHCAVMRTRIGERDWVMVLLDARGNASRSADAERIRHWLDPAAAQAERLAGRKTARKPVQTKSEGRRVRRTFGN